MSQRAKVTSIDALRDFRAMLSIYQDAARDAAELLAMECRRGVNWVAERPNYWENKVRRLEQDLVAAKAALEQAMCRHVGDTPASCVDEKKAIARIKVQLDEAQRKVKLARGWKTNIDKESGEFETRIHHLNDFADIDLPKSIAALERMIAALDKYASKADSAGPVSSHRPTTLSEAAPVIEFGASQAVADASASEEPA
jgi:hypothetical protein